jgi:hypothetical protein
MVPELAGWEKTTTDLSDCQLGQEEVRKDKKKSFFLPLSALFRRVGPVPRHISPSATH